MFGAYRCLPMLYGVRLSANVCVCVRVRACVCPLSSKSLAMVPGTMAVVRAAPVVRGVCGAWCAWCAVHGLKGERSSMKR